jgi:hypothetical protein
MNQLLNQKAMRTVYKYQLDLGTVTIELPENAEIITVGKDPHGKYSLWAIVNTEAVKVKKNFKILGTGHEVPNNAWYIDSFMDDMFVWHVFELV